MKAFSNRSSLFSMRSQRPIPPVVTRKPHFQIRAENGRKASPSTITQDQMEKDLMQMPEIPLTLPSSGAQGNGSGQGTGKLSLGLSKYRALVLDVSYRPILVVNWQRSLTLQIYDKVDVVETYDVSVRSATREHPLPSVIRVRLYVDPKTDGRITLNRKNILARDNHTCQYCGTAKGTMTVDHIFPQSRGGGNTWLNLVTACQRCNARKADRTLGEIGWKLIKKPREPRMASPILALDLKDIMNPPAQWKQYLLPGMDYDRWLSSLEQSGLASESAITAAALNLLQTGQHGPGAV